ncbi:hydantoinase B/oxoprolinase family protein, partial [Pseudomonas protegens]|uniref:hydantoinase B/oxoprolinase family protein n=1 Tax=Pseudomonas protegens TaxID=380021 RepID=UPI0011CE97F6
LREVPDGLYHGSAVLEDSGHGLGQLTSAAEVQISGDQARVRIDSPPQVHYFINSCAGNSVPGVDLGLMMFAQVPPPYNEGLYRC